MTDVASSVAPRRPTCTCGRFGVVAYQTPDGVQTVYCAICLWLRADPPPGSTCVRLPRPPWTGDVA